MSKQFNTIEEYLQEYQYDAIFKYVSSYVYRNQRDLGLKGYDGYDYSYAKLEDFHISKVYSEKCENDLIRLTIQVQTDIMLKFGKDRDYDEETSYKWLTLYATASIVNKFKDFKIADCGDYEPNKFSKEKSLSKGFIPYIYNEDLDDYATKFLQEYCPEALVTPTKLPVDLILKKMGLKKSYAPLEDNVFGRIFFNSAEATIYDKDNNLVTKRIPEGTILINKNCFFKRNYGNEGNTKIHECVHWWLHRHFFNLLKIINPKGSYISCEIDTEYKNDCSFSDELSWMEWQACSLAPKIMIPREMGIVKFKECLEKVGIHSENSIFSKNVRFDMAVDLFAEAFGVTKISAKIRLIELGFNQAIGVYNFVDGKVQDAFYFKEGFLKPGETFIVEPQNAAIESILNPVLREKILREEVVYVKNVFVLNDEKYFGTYKNGNHYLTSYALEHMDECCLVFDSKVNHKKDISYFNLCYLCDTLNISNTIEKKYSSRSKAELDPESLKMLVQKHQEEEEFFKTLPSHPGRTIKAHLERKGMTHQQLADRSKMSKRTCDYYMSDYDVTNPDIFDIVAICIGMNLSASYSRDLLNKFGFNIDGKHDINYDSLRFIIESCHQYTIDSCNEILRQLGCKKKIPSDSQSKNKKKS